MNFLSILVKEKGKNSKAFKNRSDYSKCRKDVTVIKFGFDKTGG